MFPKVVGIAHCPRDREPFAFAGLSKNWKEPSSDEWVRTFTILTTKPNEVIAALHDRMPVILQPDEYDRWLGEEPDPAVWIVQQSHN